MVIANIYHMFLCQALFPDSFLGSDLSKFQVYVAGTTLLLIVQMSKQSQGS
jgi:hypothetical protein